MKQVFICSRRREVIYKGRKIPRLLLGMLRGTIGKSFVVKHYRDKKGRRRKIVITHYPDMSGIQASEKQRERRNLFKEAVVYARWIISDKDRKKAFKKSLPRKKRKHVYQSAIRLYMKMQGDQQWLSKQLAVRSMMQSGRMEMVAQDKRWGVVQGFGVQSGMREMVEGKEGLSYVWGGERASYKGERRIWSNEGF